MTIGKVFSTGQQQACAYLRDKILTGELPCDTPLDPAVIADRLGLSRMPVREALRQLDAEGLVTMRPNRMAVVTNLTQSEVADMFEMRAAIEVLAVRAAMPAMDANAIGELRRLTQDMIESAADLQTWLVHHEAFHQCVADLAGRPRLAREIMRLRRAVQPYLLIIMTAAGHTELLGHEHGALVDVFATGDGAAAEAAMAAHVLSSGKAAIDAMKKNEAACRSVPEPRASRRMALA